MGNQRLTSSRTSSMEAAQTGPVRIRIIAPHDGEGVIELALDYEKAEVPARACYADYVEVLEGRADVTLVFGRLTPGTTKLRSQVEISFSRDSFVGQLWKSSRDMHDTISKNPALQLPTLEGVVYSDLVHTSRAMPQKRTAHGSLASCFWRVPNLPFVTQAFNAISGLRSDCGSPRTSSKFKERDRLPETPLQSKDRWQQSLRSPRRVE
jgi:hypothetical protein